MNPIAGAALVRSDAAWNEDKQLAGLGWTVDDENQSTSFAVSAHHVRSPLLAEGLAMREAVAKCKELGITNLQCESDSSTLIKSLNEETSNAELYGVIADIIDLASSFNFISFVWIPWKKNVVADDLAKRRPCVELAIMTPTNIV